MCTSRSLLVRCSHDEFPFLFVHGELIRVDGVGQIADANFKTIGFVIAREQRLRMNPLQIELRRFAAHR